MKVEEARAKGVEDSTADRRAAESKGSKGAKQGGKTPRRRKGRKSSSSTSEGENLPARLGKSC